MSFYDRRQWAALPMGELHSEESCAYCKHRGELDVDLRRTVIVSTHAIGYICNDTVACCARRNRAAA